MSVMIDETLLELDKKIKRIEDRDENYIENPKWQELRKQQDICYKKLAERKLKWHKKQFLLTGNPVNEKFVKIYEDYINEKS